MKKFHISIAIKNLEDSIKDYSKRLNAKPEVVVEGKFALWRTDTLNLSARVIPEQAGQVRHLGWEEENVIEFSEEEDVNGIVWESFNAEQQRGEIAAAWPGVLETDRQS